MRALDPYTTLRRDAPKKRKASASRAPTPLTDAQRDLAAEHYHLVDKVSRRVAHKFPAAFGEDDRASAGALGLLDAARTWSPTGGASFRTHARTRIWGAIRDAARDADWVPRSERIAERRTGAAPVAMIVLGAEADDDIDEERQARDLARTPEDPNLECAAERARIEAADEVRAALDRAELDWRERVLLGLRAQGRTLAQVGAELGVSESRACQLQRSAVNSVRWWHGLGDESPSFGRGGG